MKWTTMGGTIKPISLLLIPSALATTAYAADHQPNVVVILCDDMGYGDLGCYGQPYISTPNIDSLASHGTRFTQAYAGSPVSAPSRACLMTGQHTGHTLVRGNKEYWPDSPRVTYGINEEYAVTGQQPYDPDRPILTELMHRNGYKVGMFGKWAGGYEGSESTPDKRGVDDFYGYICQFQAHSYYPNFLNCFSREKGDTAMTRHIMEQNVMHPLTGPGSEQRTQYSADLIHHRALQWLDNQTADQPFFALLTYTLPHAELVQPRDSVLQDYLTRLGTDYDWQGDYPSRYNSTHATHAQFAAMITRLDKYVGEIARLLHDKGLSDNTLLIFTSDNGPHEEGGADPTFFGRDGKLRGLKRQCLEGGIRIPFIAYQPGHVPAGRQSDMPIAFYDLLPTLCTLTQSNDYQALAADSTYFDGLSFLPELLGQPQSEQHPYLYWEFAETDQIALRKGDYKLLIIHGQPHLYDLSTDLHEDHDIAAEHPEIVAAMIEIIRREHQPSPDYPVTMP